MIRNAQASAQERFDAEHIATQETIEKAMQSQAFRDLAVPRITELESMIFKMRSELIDYIVAHGLVDGLIFDGVLQPVQNGKIVITKELIETITEKLGYYKEEDVERFLNEYLPKNFYVSDEHYVHTDNNYTGEDKEKLAGIEDGAEVNKIINVLFNGVSVLDDGTRVATINITPEDIKQWYESNANTNAFTDKEKAKLAGISDGAEVNRVDDVLVNSRSVLDENKRAIITKEIVKEAYEANDNTNAFTDDEKAELNQLFSERLKLATINVNELQDIQGSDPDIQPGVYPISVSFKAVVADANGATRTFNGVNVVGTGNIDSGCYISTLTTLSGNYKASAEAILVGAILTDEANQFLLTLVFDSSREPGYTPATVVCSDFKISVNEAVNAISVDNEKQLPAHGVVNLDLADKYVPYTGATSALDLGYNSLIAGDAEIGDFSILSDSISFDNGDGTVNRISMGGDTVAFKTRDDESGSSLTRVNVGTPTSDDNAATKKYVDETAKKLVPYTGAETTVNLNKHDLVGVGAIRSFAASIFTESLTLRSDYDIVSSGARIVALLESGIRFEKGESTELAPIHVGTPTEDTQATTKKYVDEAIAGAGGGGALETVDTITKADIIVLTMNNTVTCTTSKSLSRFDIESGTWNTYADQFTLYAGQRIVLQRWLTNANGNTYLRSVNPVHDTTWLYSPNITLSLGVYFSGISGNKNVAAYIDVPGFGSISDGDIASNATVKYYKYVD